jgi:hypothetical protein
MSMVHISYGMNKPASPDLLSKSPSSRAWPRPRWAAHGLDWKAYRDDYASIRDDIEKVFDDFHDYNARVAKPGGFHLKVASREREWITAAARRNSCRSHRAGYADPRARASTANA